MATTSVRTADAYRTEPRSHLDFSSHFFRFLDAVERDLAETLSGLTRRLFRSCGDARSLSLRCFCGWLFCNRRLLPHRLLGSLRRRLFRSCGRARSLSLCCFGGGPFAAFLFFFGNADAGFAFRFAAVGRFLAAPIAAPERAPITVPMTGIPTTVPATAPATAPPRALPVVPVGLSAVFPFLSSSMFFPPSWREDARPHEPTCQRALSFYSLARAGTFGRRLVADLLLGASRLGSDCAAFPCPWRPPSGSFGKGGSFTRPWPGYDMLFCRLIARSPSSKA